MTTPDLGTEYLGLRLVTPVVSSASPLGRDVEMLRRLQDAGAGAVVLPSLFEEQLEADARAAFAMLHAGRDTFAESLTYFPEPGTWATGPEPYLAHVEQAKDTLEIPVVASLNGTTPGGWTRYARQLEDAGADALELNVYSVAADPAVSGAQLEAQTLELVGLVRATVGIPLAVKISPFYSALANFAVALEHAGADGIVVFNRFVQPDLDLERLAVAPGIRLSSPDELLLPLRWVGLLRPHLRGSLALTSGVHGPVDAAKALLAGADVVMCASALLRHGPDRLRHIVTGLREWLDAHGYESVRQARGALSASNAPNPVAYERSQYLQALTGGSFH